MKVYVLPTAPTLSEPEQRAFDRFHAVRHDGLDSTAALAVVYGERMWDLPVEFWAWLSGLSHLEVTFVLGTFPTAA